MSKQKPKPQAPPVPEPSAGLSPQPEGYADWLADLKGRIHTAQQRAILAVNLGLVGLYWQIGRDILARQHGQGWGAKVIARLAHDLRAAFPEMKGFSRANLMYMRAFAGAWPEQSIVQQLVGRLPWGHNLVLLTRLKDSAQRLAYARAAIDHGWSRNVLNIHIETRLLERTGQGGDEFRSHVARPAVRLGARVVEGPLSPGLPGPGARGRRARPRARAGQTRHRVPAGTGRGFRLRQPAGVLDVGGDDFFIDLLFYHLKLRCYVVIELKGGKFKPEHLGQLSFYLTAVDAQVKHALDGPTIGMLLCKNKNKVVAEYALRNNTQPMGVAEYQLVESLPPELQTSLPSIEQIERELGGAADSDHADDPAEDDEES